MTSEAMQVLVVVVSDYQESNRFLIIFKINTYAALLELCFICKMYEAINLLHNSWCHEVLCTGPDFVLCL